MDESESTDEGYDADCSNTSSSPVTNNASDTTPHRALPLRTLPTDQSSPPPSSPPSQHHQARAEEDEEEEEPRPYNIDLDESYDNLYEQTYDSDSDFDPNEDYDPERQYANWQLQVLYERCRDELCSPLCDHVIRYLYPNDHDDQRKSDDEEGNGSGDGEGYEENIRYSEWLSTAGGDPMEVEEEERDGKEGLGYGEAGVASDDEE